MFTTLALLSTMERDEKLECKPSDSIDCFCPFIRLLYLRSQSSLGALTFVRPVY
jgi:hypothetical protein